MFVLGGKVKGGLYGSYPSMQNLDSGDLKYTTDFRRVYTTLLKNWLNADPTKVLSNRFEPVAFYKGMRETGPTSGPSDSGPGEDDPMMSGMMKK